MTTDLTPPAALIEMEEIAKAATQGGWHRRHNQVSLHFNEERHVLAECAAPVRLYRILADEFDAIGKADANAAHIATFDPPTALALLAEITRLTARAETTEAAEAERDEAVGALRPFARAAAQHRQPCEPFAGQHIIHVGGQIMPRDVVEVADFDRARALIEKIGGRDGA